MKNETVTKDLRLLSVVSCKTSQSKNKNLHFRYEMEGAKLYLKRKTTGEYVLSKKPIPKAVTVTVKKNTYPVFLYIPVLNKIREEGDLSIFYQDDNTYIVRPSTEEEKVLRKKQKIYPVSGHLILQSNGSYINLIKSDYETLYATGLVQVHVVSDEHRLYLEMKAVPPDTKLPSLAEAASPYGGWGFLGNAKEYTYGKPVTEALKSRVPEALGSRVKRSISRKIPIPISFIRKTGMKNGERFHTYFRDDGTFVVEPHALHCDVCGKEIGRYEDAEAKAEAPKSRAHDAYICKACHHELPTVQAAVRSKQSIPVEELSEKLADIRNELTTLLK